MATITLSTPDENVQRIIAAFNVDDNQRNGESNTAFIRRVITDMIKERVMNAERRMRAVQNETIIDIN